MSKDKNELFRILNMKIRKENIETIEDLKNCYVKCCINSYPSTNKNNEPMLYIRDDLEKWAKEAYDNGESFFYCEPVDKNYPDGKLQLCEPKYEYRIRNLSEEEFNSVFKSLIDNNNNK